jgi:tetratricopeptide (TPR) repeat protein
MYYTTKQIREILGLTPTIVSRLIEAGFVTPERGPRREYRFSFQDLVVLRAAKGLADARLPARRISKSLKKLREQLPKDVPSNGLRIAAVGDSVAVLKGHDAWRADDGQYLLAFEVAPAPQGQLRILEPKRPTAAPSAVTKAPPAARPSASADAWFEEGCRIEEADGEKAALHYQNALDQKVCHAGIYANLGRLLHQMGRRESAEAVYRTGAEACPDDALIHFNLGVLLDELGRVEEAIASYGKALQHDARLADAHYNIAVLYEALGKPREALRHFSACRKLEK